MTDVPYSCVFNTRHTVSYQTFIRNLFVLQDMPYNFIKDQVGIQNTPTFYWCDNDIIFALKWQGKVKDQVEIVDMANFLLKDQVAIKGFWGKFNVSWLRVPWLVFKTKKYSKDLLKLHRNTFFWLFLPLKSHLLSSYLYIQPALLMTYLLHFLCANREPLSNLNAHFIALFH